MYLLSSSKIKHFLNHAPVWQKFPALVILCYPVKLISHALAYRLRHGDWEMNWAIKLEDLLYTSILMALFWTWQTRKTASKNEQDEQQRS
jgi:hypothetical protein